MLIKLLLLFTLVPLVELYLLIRLGSLIGALATVVLVAVTGVIGATLAKSQGFKIINKIKDALARGKMPTDQLIEGLFILIGGAMLLTPGLLTDLTGLALIIPPSRIIFRKLIKKKFQHYISRKNFKYNSINYYDINDQEH